MTLDGVEVQSGFLVGVGRNRCGHGAAGCVGRDDGLQPDLLHLLEPALLPQIRVCRLTAEESARSRRPEGASLVLPDDAGTFAGEGVCDGVHVLLGNEDHQLAQITPGRDDLEGAAQPERLRQGDRDAMGGSIVARVCGVDGEAAANSSRYQISGVGAGVYAFQGAEDQGVVEEQEVRILLLRFLEDLLHRRERDQYSVRFRRRIPDLEPRVVPVLGERRRGYPLDGLRYVPHARHG